MPTFFTDKIRNRLKGQLKRIIPYSQFTYDVLAIKVVNEGISLCNDIKLKMQLKK